MSVVNRITAMLISYFWSIYYALIVGNFTSSHFPNEMGKLEQGCMGELFELSLWFFSKSKSNWKFKLKELMIDHSMLWHRTLKEFKELNSVDSINPRWESAYLCKQRLSALTCIKKEK